jgi:hypothetical protein
VGNATVQDLYPDESDFETLLDDAEGNAANDWEINFVSDLREKYEKFGRRMFLSQAQQEHLERIADDR